MEQLKIVYLLINSITFLIFGIDKLKAQRQTYRIPEKILLLLAIFGPLGAFLGMQLFRHKTQKPKFKFLVPLFLAIHVFTVVFMSGVYGAEATPSKWAESGYNQAVEKGYITDALQTDLQSGITRKDFVELIISSYEKVMGEIPNISISDNPFTDTDSLAVVKANKINVVVHSEDRLFNPDSFLNREQMIVILVRMNRAVEIRMNENMLLYRDIALEFTDIDEVSNWALESFQIGIFNEIIAGVGDNRLGAKELTTKEQAILLNLRLMLSYEQNTNLSGYVKSTLNEDSKTMDGQKGYVSVSILNMRQSPDLSSSGNIIRKLRLNEEVELLEKEGEWYQVMASNNELGYVFAEFINIYQEDLSSPEAIVEMIDYAKQFVGTNYVYAGTSLTKGIDCSSYTQQIMAPYGVLLNRSSSGQYLNGIPVAVKDMQPGDLVFYGYKSGITHVALYIGNKQVIHATTTYGVAVTQAFGWMSTPFVGVKRVLF